MLEPAIKYKEQLEQAQYGIWFDDKYKYWNCDVYYDTLQINTDSWNKHQFVSVVNGEVIGYIAYNVSRADNSVNTLSIMNFSDNKAAFGVDLGRALRDIFEKWDCNLELLRGELERVTIKEDNKIEEIADKMESLKRVMGHILNEE